jgi:hypothetical protein
VTRDCNLRYGGRRCVGRWVGGWVGRWIDRRCDQSAVFLRFRVRFFTLAQNPGRRAVLAVLDCLPCFADSSGEYDTVHHHNAGDGAI